MDRRQFFTCSTLGAGTLALSGCGTTGWEHQTGTSGQDTQPFAPWDALDTLEPHDPVILPAAAILASNPHNTQPWTMVLDEARFQIRADTERHLGAFDPFQREMWIGLGCAVANAEIIAGAAGFRTGRASLSNLGGNGAGRVSVRFGKIKTKPHPLAQFIHVRRTNRAPYENTMVQKETLQRVHQLVGRISGAQYMTFGRTSERGQSFARGTIDATRAINADQIMSRDSHAWFRSNATEVAKYRDGVSLPTAGLSPAASFFGQLLPEPSQEKSGAYWLSSTQRQVENAGGFGIITVKNPYLRSSQIAAGRLWQRLQLALTSQGVAAQPLNQLPEVVDRDRSLGEDRGWRKKLYDISGGAGTVTLAFRFGHPKRQVPHSARRPVDWVLPS